MALTLSGDDGVAGVNGSATTPAIQGTDTNTGLTFGTDTVNVVTGGSTRTTVDSSGRLLIGETSSTQAGSIDAKAQIVSSDFNAALTVRRNQASDGAPGMLFCKSRGTSNSANVAVNSGDGLGNIRFFGADATGGNDFAEGGAISCVVDGTPGSDDMPGRLEFKTTADGASSPTTQMRLASNGRLTVGATTADNGHFISNSGSDTSTLRLRQLNNGGGVLSLYYVGASNLNANDRYLSCIPSDGAGSARCFINSNGGIQNYQSNDSNLCDEREKKNIVDLDSTWDCLKHWELKKFHYNEDADTDDKRYGVIAQQVAPHCPEVISEWTKIVGKEAVLDEDGNEVEPAVEEVLRMGVKEQQMMWMAIKALQEAQTRIEQLETRVAQLEGGAS